DAEQSNVIGRGHGRGPRTTVEQRHLAEEVAGAELGLGLAADRDPAVALEDKEQPDPALALARDQRPRLVRHLFRRPRDDVELALGALGEDRDLGELGRHVVLRHWSSSSRDLAHAPGQDSAGAGFGSPPPVGHRILPTPLPAARGLPPAPRAEDADRRGYDVPVSEQRRLVAMILLFSIGFGLIALASAVSSAWPL